MPWSAYPKDYKLGSDNQSWLMRLKFKYFQVPLTGGPRVPKGFWKWREYPIVLFAIRGAGAFRWERSDGSKSRPDYVSNCIFYDAELTKYWGSGLLDTLYLSRIQPWCRWHIALLFPIGITWHIFWKKKDIIPVGEYKSDFGIKKLFAGYLGWIRDSDKIYKPKLYTGGNFE